MSGGSGKFTLRTSVCVCEVKVRARRTWPGGRSEGSCTGDCLHHKHVFAGTNSRQMVRSTHGCIKLDLSQELLNCPCEHCSSWRIYEKTMHIQFQHINESPCDPPQRLARLTPSFFCYVSPILVAHSRCALSNLNEHASTTNLQSRESRAASRTPSSPPCNRNTQSSTISSTNLLHPNQSFHCPSASPFTPNRSLTFSKSFPSFSNLSTATSASGPWKAFGAVRSRSFISRHSF